MNENHFISYSRFRTYLKKKQSSKIRPEIEIIYNHNRFYSGIFYRSEERGLTEREREGEN